MNEVIKGLPLDQQQEIEAQAPRLIEEEMTVRDLRKARELTQERRRPVFGRGFIEDET
ncbi:MAG: hypothetical protein P4L43_00230 [Syntrophobacteraceae bacterium]|nr:hypothetical protein [Syntrophobacteraceae bacterium]